MAGAFVEQVRTKLRGEGKRQSLMRLIAAAFLSASVCRTVWAQSGSVPSATPGTWAGVAAFVDTPWMTVILLVAGCWKTNARGQRCARRIQ